MQDAGLVRSIPAYAGEAFDGLVGTKTYSGRSPRMRGRRSRKEFPAVAVRSIPAYAGEASKEARPSKKL